MDPDAVADLRRVTVPVGGRVLVVSDLRLDDGPSPVALELAHALDALSGPSLLIFNGNLTADPALLAAHPELVGAVQAYASGRGRTVLALAGDRDAQLAWSAAAPPLNAEVALAAEVAIETGAGTRLVRVEPGHRLDPLAALGDPRNAAETPLAYHLRRDLLPSVRRHERGGWVTGIEQLADPGAFPRFLASRLAYRRLARPAWLLLVPVVVALALRVPALAWHDARAGALGTRLGVFALATAVELILLALVAGAGIRRAAGAISALAVDPERVGRSRPDPNDAARAVARDLITAGHAGLITGHTCQAELTHLGGGFYANTGCAADVVTETSTRWPSLGLPPVFLPHRQVAWVEIEAGVDLHVRLLHGVADLPGATLLERLVADPRAPQPTPSGPLHPAVVATFPQGESWPPAPTRETAQRRVRRLAAVVVALAGFVCLSSAVSEPFRDRLNVVNDVFPLVVPETAAALAALAGVALLVLARGVRRGQRRAWLVCQALLLAVAVLHLIRGVGVEEAVVALAAAGFLWVQRRSFQAASDVPPVRRALIGLLAAAGLTAVAGTLALELGSWVRATRAGHPLHRIGWIQAFQASVERMVGVTNVSLPYRIDEFFAPGMAVAMAGLVLVGAVLVFRPVVRRHRGSAASVAATSPLERARGVVARHGSGTLDYFALRPDKEFFFWGDTVVAYGVYGGVCLVSPDPIGPAAEREEAWRAFRQFVDGHGWALGGLGAAEGWLPIYRATGMHDLYVGDEAVVAVQPFTLEGGRFKGLRQAVNRVAKYGYTISFHDPARLDPTLRTALLDVMTKSRRGDVERGFSMTLGRAFDPEDEGLLLAVVHGPPDTGGAPVAFCQYVPAPGIGGYSLDLMRRDDGEHPNGLLDFAVVETIREVARRGGAGLGLNFATMRAVLAGEAGEGLSQRVQAWLLRRMGESMQIESLWKFNAKFDPEWLPRYATYDASENALAVAIAVARAESFWELPVIGRFLTPVSV